jgi:hypothetical protein
MDMETRVEEYILVAEISVLFVICKLSGYSRYILREKETSNIFEICFRYERYH